MRISGCWKTVCAAVTLAMLASFALLTLPPTAALAADWPQWRGPDGAGVGPDSVALPETWAPESANVRWRAAIPGQGISSPIVVGDRVVVTTALEGSDSGLRNLLVRGGAVLLAALVAVLALARYRSSANGNRRPARWVVGGSLLFALLMIALAVRPELFLETGNPGRLWRVGGGLALLGLAAAFAWFRPASGWRLFGVAALLLGAFAVAYWMPAGPRGPVKLEKKLIGVLPGLVPACWYLIHFFKARRRAGAASPVYRPLLSLPLLVLAALAFVIPNYLNALQRVVVGLDLASGEILWQTPVFSAAPEQKWEYSTYATPTPASDGERVFAYFGSGLAAVDLDGRPLWVRRFPEYTHGTRYGAASSPVVAGDAVIVVQEEEAYQDGPPSWIAAFDRETGETLWRVNPPDAHDSYTTPTLVGSGSERQLVTASWHLLAAYDAATGERLWSLEYPMEQLVASFARAGDLLAVSGGVYGEKELLVLRIAPAGKDTRAEVAWRTGRGVATIASPVLYDGKLFTVTDGGIMTCYEAETGETLWKQRLPGEYFASLVAGDGKVYATNTDGATTVLAADAEFRTLATNELDGTVYATPAIARDCLLVRTASDLYCIAADGASGPAVAAVD